MPIYNTLYGLPATSVAYLNQALPDISNIFGTIPASTTTSNIETAVAQPAGLTAEQLALLYPQNIQNIQSGNDGIKSLNVQDFEEALAQRQDRLNNPGGFAEFVYGMLPGLKPQSIESILSGGAQPQMTIPGLTGILSKADKYYDLPYGDQAFIASQMGYTDPNTGMANKDPYGINVRSAFGNYADYTENKATELEDYLSGGLADKYGATYDPITGMYIGTNAAKANQMTKRLREQQQFYKTQTAKKNQMIQDAFDKQIIKQQQIDTGDITTGPTGPINVVDEVALTGGGGRDRDDGPSTSPSGPSYGGLSSIGSGGSSGTFGTSTNNASTFSDYS